MHEPYFRKDNRVVSETVSENEIIVLQLQTNGTEPLIISNNGSDVQIASTEVGLGSPCLMDTNTRGRIDTHLTQRSTSLT